MIQLPGGENLEYQSKVSLVSTDIELSNKPTSKKGRFAPSHRSRGRRGKDCPSKVVPPTGLQSLCC